MTQIRIETADWSERPVTLRLPFQFGAVTLRATGEAQCRLQVLVGDRLITGRSAQLMVPRWFDKRPALSAEATVEELREAVRASCAAAPGLSGTLAAVAQDLRDAAIDAQASDTPLLAAGFGPALLEMALIDALCQGLGLPFWQAAREDLFGLGAHLPADLPRAAFDARRARIAAPQRMALRHTVGHDAPLTEAELTAEAPQDGLPVALTQVIATQGMRAFKIKLKGAPEADLARLRAIAPVISGLPDLAITLDANEQYAPDSFAEFLRGWRRDPALAALRGALRFVEQPFDRATALAAPLPDRLGVPLVIDESDDHRDAMAEALRLGWAGSSIKSCKGVLRALVNAARAEAQGALLSGEDLTCQPGLCWQQDMAMMAACGVPDVERNGHHFGGGMQGAPDTEVATRLATHGDIYDPATRGLRIAGGAVSLASLDRAGFGGV